MTKTKKGLIGWLITLVLCAGMLAGVLQGAAPAVASAQDDYTIGISVPESGSYNDLANAIAARIPSDYNVYSWNYQDAEEQIEQLDKMITRNVDAIIIVPSDEEALADAFREIRSEGIDLFVIGDYIENSPEGTVFFSNDYYVLGLSHANWIRSGSDFNADSVIYLYYASDANGQLYKQGVLDGLAVLDMPGAITCVEVTGLQDIDHALNDWFEEHGGEEVKENVTYSSAFAERVLQYYHAHGYSDAASGTGIRAFSDPTDEDAPLGYDDEYAAYLSSVGQSIADTIQTVLEGGEPENATEINGCYVVYYDFVPGYIKYVSR